MCGQIISVIANVKAGADYQILSDAVLPFRVCLPIVILEKLDHIGTITLVQVVPAEDKVGTDMLAFTISLLAHEFDGICGIFKVLGIVLKVCFHQDIIYGLAMLFLQVYNDKQFFVFVVLLICKFVWWFGHNWRGLDDL